MASLSRRIESAQHLLDYNADERKRNEEQHLARVKAREQLKQREDEERELQREKAQSLIQEQEKRLERMRDKWTAPSQPRDGAGDSGGAQAKKRAKKSRSKVDAEPEAAATVESIFKSDSENEKDGTLATPRVTNASSTLDDDLGLDDSDASSSPSRKRARVDVE
jgi:hypothetical protein